MGKTRKRSRFPLDERDSSLNLITLVRNRNLERRKHGNRGLRMRNVGKNTRPTISANPNIQPARSRYVRVVIPPRKVTVERYDLRSRHGFLTARRRTVINSITPDISDNQSIQKARRKIPSVIAQPLDQIIVCTENGIRISRVFSNTNDTPSAIVKDSHTHRTPTISSREVKQSPNEILEKYNNLNDRRVSGERSPRNDSATAIPQDVNTIQEPNAKASVESQTLSQIEEENVYQNAHYSLGSSMETVRNCSPTAIVEDLNSQQASSTNKCVESRLLSENEEGFERWDEPGIRFSRFRNERDETSDSVALDTNTQQIPSVKASIGCQPMSETARGYECSICLDTRNQSEMIFLPCLHKFHKKCIKKWLNKYEMCPICRLSTEDV